jgi:hypothetical protein
LAPVEMCPAVPVASATWVRWTAGALDRGFALRGSSLRVRRSWDPVKRASEARVVIRDADVFDPSLHSEWVCTSK